MLRSHSNHRFHRRKRPYLTAALAIMLGYLTGCSTSTPTRPTPPPRTTVEQPSQMQPDEVESLALEAQNLASPAREKQLLQAAKEFASLELNHRASNILANLSPDTLPPELLSRYTILYSSLALEDDDYFLAEQLLTAPELDTLWATMPSQDEIDLRKKRADVFMLLGSIDESIKERMRLSELYGANTPEDQSNQFNLWQALQSLPVEQLREQAETASNQEAKGWYEIAAISKSNLMDIEQQHRAVEAWQTQNPEHPAAVNLPTDLQMLSQIIADKPRQVAVLLPQSGSLQKAGNAVRDGILAAHYSAHSQDTTTMPALRFYDTNNANIHDLVLEALEDGAEAIIGPLEKSQVVALSQEPQLPVTVLAVNYLDAPNDQNATDQDEEPQTTPANFYQFGLSSVDEARQTAQRAWVEGHRYAMILTANSNWAERSADNFQTAWEDLGGTVADAARFPDSGSYSETISHALLIDESEHRHQKLQQVLGENLHFEARRRQDVDLIYLVSRPAEARQIKPTLAFYYAADLPVYASSHIYDGRLDPRNDRDLSGIRFSTLPWYFDHEGGLKQLIETTAAPPAAYQSLYALGVDSYRLYPRLRQLQGSPAMRLPGETGNLGLTSERQIYREQIWAQMRNGKAILLPNRLEQEP